jgi:hypothetical protein
VRELGCPVVGMRYPVSDEFAIGFADQPMAYFPDEPVRFVGRAAAMARASAALAPDSGKTGVLLHGMAGAGKTACALELAYRHQDAFAALAFWQAPTKGRGVGKRPARPREPARHPARR